MSEEGKLPPYDEYAEKATLGAMLMGVSPDEIFDLSADHFYVDSHRRTFDAILAVHGRGDTVDFVSVNSELRSSGRAAQVDAAYVRSLTSEMTVVSPQRLRGYALTVRNRSVLRDALRFGQKCVAQCYVGVKDLGAFVDELSEAVHGLTKTRAASTTMTMKEATKKAFTRLVDHANRGGGLIGTPTGYHAVDGILGGLHAGDLTIVAARPAMGKSALVMGVCGNVVRGPDPDDLSKGKGAIVFSLEMPAEQLAIRALCSEGEVDLLRTRFGNLSTEDWKRLTQATIGLCSSPNFLLDDGGATTIAEIRAKSRKAQREMARTGVELGVIAVDYIQLVNNQKESREQAISEVSRALKALAKELGVPVIGLSQLNRAVESRADKRPMLSDLRESGAIEQDADNVVALYRDDYYNEKSDTPGECEVLVLKQRNGPTGTVSLRFRKESATFCDLGEAR